MIFIKKGDEPLSRAQAINRGLAIFEAEKSQYEREAGLLLGSQEYVDWANQWLVDNEVNAANNLFNHQLAAFRAAKARLNQYRLADGLPEQTFEEPSGEYDEDGNERAQAQAVIDQTPVEVKAFVDAEGVIL